MADSSRILVLGAGGLLGRHLVALGVEGLDRSACDVTSPAHRERALRTHRPDAVLYCAAQASVDACETDAGSWTVNVEAAEAWARRVELWYVSTNYVFSGPGPHRPHDTTAPLQTYGRQKRAAELAVLAAGGHVVRTGWIFGAGGHNFLSRLPGLLREGPVRAFGGSLIQPTWAHDLALWVRGLPRGLTHAVGREQTTFAEAARDLARAMGLGDRVDETPGPAGVLPAARPSDARLEPAVLPGWSERLRTFLSGRLVPPSDHHPGRIGPSSP